VVAISRRWRAEVEESYGIGVSIILPGSVIAPRLRWNAAGRHQVPRVGVSTPKYLTNGIEHLCGGVRAKTILDGLRRTQATNIVGPEAYGADATCKLVLRIRQKLFASLQEVPAWPSTRPSWGWRVWLIPLADEQV